MEIHRLQPMKPNYPKELFEKLYKEVRPLIKALAYQIDNRRYGVSRDVIESWFDDKFIFVFNKHFDNKEPEVLKGFIINSLRTFKYRVLRKAYSKEADYLTSVVNIGDDDYLMNIIPDDSLRDTHSIYYDLMDQFMKDKLSDNAYILLSVQLNPPPYILSQLNKQNSRIPDNLLSEYLGVSVRVIKNLKSEISKAIKSAKEYFSEYSLAPDTI